MSTPAETRANLRAAAHRLRAIPYQLGQHEHRVFVHRITWTGPNVGEGDRSDVVTELVNAGGAFPKVHWLSERTLALGNLEDGSCKIGPLTPLHTGCDGDPAGVDPAVFTATAGQQLLLRIVGPKHPAGAFYRVTDTSSDKPLRLMITASPEGDAVYQPPEAP